MPSLRDKLKSRAAIARISRQAQAKGRRVVFTNGCFDLLHAGHVRLLEKAKQLGDVLIVGINSDASVRAQEKGPGRPVTTSRDRAEVVAGLRSVDYVVEFDEPTPARLVAGIRPDVLIKGADWSATSIVGRNTVLAKGGKVVRFPLVKGYSTTELIRRIKAGKPAGGRRR
jgi:rfaE bifunctional protein nucleotidyltransferase chain/domain